MKYLLPLVAVLLFSQCSDDNGDSTWAIPKDEVLDGGPGKDGIPAVDNPQYISVSQVDFLTNSQLILGIMYNGEVYGFPHNIMDWHEIANVIVGEQPMSIVYCPLTGTGTAWNRVINGTTTTFGVSGLLFNTNVIPYDRATDSNWSQLRGDCVNGSLEGTEIEDFHLIQTTWGTWKNAYPNSQILSTNTGFNRNYQQYPYGDYDTDNNDIYFPLSLEDGRVPNKDLMLGLITNTSAIVYPVNNGSSQLTLTSDEVNGVEVTVIRDLDDAVAIAYENTLDGTGLSFEAIQDSLPIIMKDQEGNRWDMLGKAVSGPRQGQVLNAPKQVTGYWLAFPPFYPGLELR